MAYFGEKRVDINEPLNARSSEDQESREEGQTRLAPPVKTGGIQVVEDKIDSTWEMISKISSLAIFPIIGMIFHPAYLICNAIVFNEEPKIQEALAMGGLVLSILLLSLGVTFNGALDTLISQAYGQKDLRLCRVYLNRQLYLTTFVYFVLATPLMYVENMILALGSDEETASAAATYVHVMIPGVLFYSW